jgi:hypothetical protein
MPGGRAVDLSGDTRLRRADVLEGDHHLLPFPVLVPNIRFF